MKELNVAFVLMLQSLIFCLDREQILDVFELLLRSLFYRDRVRSGIGLGLRRHCLEVKRLEL